VILEGLDKNGRGVLFAKAIDEQNFRVHAIIVANEAADETNNNDGRSGRNGCRSSGGL